MFIHFAFGNLGRLGKIEEQTNAATEYISREKRLKVSKCKWNHIKDFREKLFTSR